MTADIADTAAVRETIRRYRVTAAMHFAALLSVGDSVAAPARYYENNVCGTLALLDALVRESVGLLVFSSTAAVYGEPLRTPIAEDHATRPINAYGETKLAVERALPHYERAYGLRSVRLRYFKRGRRRPARSDRRGSPPRGASDSARAGSGDGRGRRWSSSATTTPPRTAPAAGTTCTSPTWRGRARPRRSRRSRRASRRASTTSGTDAPSRCARSSRAVERIAGRRVRHELGPRRPGDPAVLLASSARARSELGWEPIYEELDVIVETAWRWHRSHPRGYAS